MGMRATVALRRAWDGLLVLGDLGMGGQQTDGQTMGGQAQKTTRTEATVGTSQLTATSGQTDGHPLLPAHEAAEVAVGVRDQVAMAGSRTCIGGRW